MLERREVVHAFETLTLKNCEMIVVKMRAGAMACASENYYVMDLQAATDHST